MNILEAYNRYRKDTESHENFHLWCCIHAVSVLLGRKCFLPQGAFTVYPQTYVVIVGEAALRKSTAMNVAKKLVDAVGSVPIAPASLSREALVDFMADSPVRYSMCGKDYVYHQTAAFANEFDTFVGGQHLNKGMITFMTDIWDGDLYKEQTRKSGVKEIHYPYFSVIGCCVPSWFESSVKGDLITGGFTRRTIFVYEEDIDHLEAWPESTSEEQRKAWVHMVSEAQRISKMSGEFRFTKNAIALYSKWYHEQHKTKREVDEKLKSYYSSRHILLQKVAMSLSACYSSDMVIDCSILELANDLLKRTENNLEKLFRGIGRNELKGVSERVLDFITKNGPTGVTNRAIVKAFYSEVSLQELEEVMEALRRSGMIQTKTDLQNLSEVIHQATSSNTESRQNSGHFARVCQRSPSDEARPSQQVSRPPPAVQASLLSRSDKSAPASSNGKAKDLLASLTTSQQAASRGSSKK